MLPRRREKPRSGIERAPKREWPRHQAFVRKHECCVPNCNHFEPIEFAHVRSAANSGTGLKPPDWEGVSLCRFHHEMQHTGGAHTFEVLFGINLRALAAEFAARSPDIKMKAAMKEAGLG